MTNGKTRLNFWPIMISSLGVIFMIRSFSLCWHRNCLKIGHYRLGASPPLFCCVGQSRPPPLARGTSRTVELCSCHVICTKCPRVSTLTVVLVCCTEVRFGGETIQSLKESVPALVPVSSPVAAKKPSTPPILKRGKRKRRVRNDKDISKKLRKCG